MCSHVCSRSFTYQGSARKNETITGATSVLPQALHHRKQKEDVKPLEPLFPQAEWISFPSLASALRTSRGQWDGLTPHGQSPGASTHDPLVYLLSLHSQLPVSLPGVILGERHQLPRAGSGRDGPSQLHTHTLDTLDNKLQDKQGTPKDPRKSKGLSRTKLRSPSPWHRAVTQHRQGQAAAAPLSPAGVRAGRARGCHCHQPPPLCRETAQI